MRKIVLLLSSFCLFAGSNAQKSPLDHSVYDSWQSIGEKLVSNDGRWVVCTVNVQEGDNELVIWSSDAKHKQTIPRGYSARVTEDSRYLLFRIKPLYKETRDAKMKRDKPGEMPADSLGIVELGKDSVWKMPGVKTYKTPEKGYGWVAYHLDKKTDTLQKTGGAAGRQLDSLTRVIDSLKTIIGAGRGQLPENGNDKTVAAEDDSTTVVEKTGTDLVLRNLEKGEETVFAFTTEYLFSSNGQKLLILQSRNPGDAQSKSFFLCYDLRKGFADTLSRNAQALASFALSDDGSQIAWVTETEAGLHTSQAGCQVWYYKEGMDSAVMLVDKNTVGMRLGSVVSKHGALYFSKSGKRLFFGTSLLQPLADTTLTDIDRVQIDIWHYNDDYLQTTQLNRLQRDREENFLAVYHLDKNKLVQLGSREIPVIISTNEGDGDQFAGISDVGKRIESQWIGNTRKDIYAIAVDDGTAKLVKNDLEGVIVPSYISPTGKYIMWYDGKEKDYFVWDGKTVRNISSRIKLPLYNEEYDLPSDPPPYGVMGWMQEDSAVYIYDRYDIWKIGFLPAGVRCVTKGMGRKAKTSYRYTQFDPGEKYIGSGLIMTRRFNEKTKQSGLEVIELAEQDLHAKRFVFADNEGPFYVGQVMAAGHTIGKGTFIYTKESFQQSPDLYVAQLVYDNKAPVEGSPDSCSLHELRLSSFNPQQVRYNWGTAELFKWKAYTGREAEGIVYKPEDFDPAKKYPLICYFYERHSGGLYVYQPPVPTTSRLNISFFVSRGYIVFSPDIHYSAGHPGRDAYDHVVSGARALVKRGFVDSTRIGLQGQSWGGYQVAYLITATNLFKAAWAGAPVANMTSAYGAIRWESGLNRQFQYEKTQSRIGATLWEKPQRYIEGSPLFHLPAVKTPLVIMHNDADGAVPWYQGIELFTGLRRLGKKVWLLNYNGEGHNLVQRKNRKDVQLRQQQFFDWLLKNEKPAKWLTEGVPAVDKGKEWGLE